MHTGDRIHHPSVAIEGTVQGILPGGQADVLWDDGTREYIGDATAPTVRVGERVAHPSVAIEGTVVGIQDDQVIVRWDDGTSGSLPQPTKETNESLPQPAKTTKPKARTPLSSTPLSDILHRKVTNRPSLP